MILGNKFVFISGDKRDVKDKVYCNVNAECVADGDVWQFSTTPEVFAQLQKYKEYYFHVDIFKYVKDGKTNIGLNLVDVQASK